MTARIKRLAIHSFRGATQPLDLSFDVTKPVVLIFGENGTGKSTIVDAIECVGSGSTAFLDDWKLGKGKRKESFIPTLGKSLADVKIDLEFGDQTYSATLGAKGIKLCNTQDRPNTKVLRRKSLQAFIDADPAQRYKEVASFLDIPQIEASETALRQAYKEAKDTFEFASKANTQALETLQGLWEAEGNPDLNEGQDAEAWARNQANTPLDALEAELAKLKLGVKRIEELASRVHEYGQANAQVIHAQKNLRQTEEKIAALESGKAQNNAQLVTLLQDAKSYLSKTPDTICPVCEQAEIEPDNLVQRLEQRIAGMDELKQANDEKVLAQKNQQGKSMLLQQAEENLLKHAIAAQEHFALDFPQLESIQGLKEDKPEQALQLALTLRSNLVPRQPELQAQLNSTQKQCHTLTSIKQLLQTLNEKSVEAKQTEALQKRLGQAVEIFEAKRKTYVETVLLEIAQDVDALYQKIHPHENMGQLKLKLDERQRGSLIYGVAFGEQQDVQPQPYYSESHLDTLGLCIFLALAKRSNTDRTVVVLDDVLGSVDQQHLKRTLDMLLEAANGFSQLVITTHYRPLRDQFRFARSPSSPVQLLELKPWNFDQGIRTGKTVVYAQELSQQLQEDDFRRDVIASQAGQLFESLLEFISRTYRCKVPHVIEPRFTFGELASSPNKALKKALKIEPSDNETSAIELAPIYSKLDEAINVRNLVGCHFNQWAGELADQDIRDMAELALELADALICANCGSLPTSNKSGSYWACSCKQTQMHPLQPPR